MPQYVAPSSWNSNEFLLCNELSKFWKPGYDSGACCKGIVYPIGMVTYAIALPARLIGLIKDLFMLIKALCSLPCADKENDLAGRAMAVAGSFAEIGIGALGVICPPIAYRLDEGLARLAQNCGFIQYCDTTGTPDPDKGPGIAPGHEG